MQLLLCAQGAGNAFLGGFFSSLVRSSSSGGGSDGGDGSRRISLQQLSAPQLADAGAWGAVTASFMVSRFASLHCARLLAWIAGHGFNSPKARHICGAVLCADRGAWRAHQACA